MDPLCQNENPECKTLGDDIRIIKEITFNTLSISPEDFWIIDEEIVLKMNYSDIGQYLGFDIITANIDRYLKDKELLLQNSLPL